MYNPRYFAEDNLCDLDAVEVTEFDYVLLTN